MSYSGDPSLASEIKERIVSTFEQALDLTDKGSRKEALLGCDFVLRLDPLFEPARVLHKRLRADESEISTADLRAILEGTPGANLGLGAIEEAAADLEPGPDMAPPLAGESITEDAGIQFAAPAAADPGFEPLSDDAGDSPSFADQIEAELNSSPGSPQLPDSPTDDSPAGSVMEPEATSDPLMAAVEPTAPEPMEETTGEEFDVGAPTHDSPEAYGTVPEDSTFTHTQEPVDTGFDAPIFDEVPPDRSGFDETPVDDSPLGAPTQLDPESERRIQELLEQGQEAFDQKEFQSAIDSWSRVFLIDIDHQEANQRIEDARRLAAEAERQVEEVFHEAMLHFDDGDLEASRQALQRVLEMQPSHLAAIEYLERIESGDVAPPPPIEVAPHLEDVTGTGFDFEGSAEYPQEDSGSQDLFTAPDIPPLAGAEFEPATAPVKPPPRKRDPRRLFISVGSLVLVLVLLGGWFLSDNWTRFFPNSQSAQDVPPPQRIDPIRRAKALHEQGRTAIAISQLRRLPPGDPHYTEAQALVAQWETAPIMTAAQGPTPGEMERYRTLLARADSAQVAGENLLVVEFLQRAASIAPLDDDARTTQADSQALLANLRDQIEIFRAGDWEYVLPALWRLREADSSNADVNRLIINSYYNLGVRDLQRGRPESAAKKFEEALSLRPDDNTLARLRAFSETYQERPEDLLYRIFVKYLPFR